MLVPLDLYILVQRLGRLTPELVLGWRVCGYVREYFNGLDGVRLAIAPQGDFLDGLKAAKAESGLPLDILDADSDSPWHALAYHPFTGTVLEFAYSSEEVALKVRTPSSENGGRDPQPIALASFAIALDRQVLHLLNEPLESLCRIRERRVTRGRSSEKEAAVRCRRCGAPLPKRDLWCEDGVLCCSECAGMPARWWALH